MFIDWFLFVMHMDIVMTVPFVTVAMFPTSSSPLTFPGHC